MKLLLTYVLYLPNIQNKLLSLPAMTEKGACIQFKGKLCELIVKGKYYSIGIKHGKLCKLDTELTHKSYFSSCNGDTSSLETWHFCYCHLGYDSLQLLKDRSMVDGSKSNPKMY